MATHSGIAGVALYSGRWRHHAEVRRLVEMHRALLIDPHHLDVVSVGFAVNMPCLNTEEFPNSSAWIWKLPPARLKAVSLNESHLPRLRPSIPLSPFKKSQLSAWQVQFAHVLQALRVAVQWKRHAYYVRARIDVVLSEVPQIDARLVNSERVVLAYRKAGGWAVDPSAAFFHDWLYVSNREGMQTIGDTHDAILNDTVRCFGACPEEQVAMHLERQRFALRALPPANVSIKRIPRVNCTETAPT